MSPLKYWKPDTFEISSYKYHLIERKNKSYTTSGNDNTNLCTYTYNELGFRGDSIKKEGFKVMAIGCSLTEGVGVNDDESWPAQICRLIPNAVNMNFGTGGRSNDFISRCLLSYYDLIKPDLVLIMYTYPHRREFYTKLGGIEPYMPTNIWGYMKEIEGGQKTQECLDYVRNSNEDFINWYKNHLLIKCFLETKKCNWVWNGCNIFNELIEDNRFDGDYNKFIDFGSDGQHPGPIHNETYANKLYTYLVDNELITTNITK